MKCCKCRWHRSFIEKQMNDNPKEEKALRLEGFSVTLLF